MLMFGLLLLGEIESGNVCFVARESLLSFFRDPRKQGIGGTLGLYRGSAEGTIGQGSIFQSVWASVSRRAFCI